jgi:UDP-N-acetyl-D-galactosamine dehydrogenase
MGAYVAAEIVKMMIKQSIKVLDARILQLGITFKENCPDCRNSHAVDVVRGLEEFGCQVDIFDPWAAPEDIEREYQLKSFDDLARIAGEKYDVIVLAVAHKEFMTMDIAGFKKDKAIIFDIKSVLPKGIADARL